MAHALCVPWDAQCALLLAQQFRDPLGKVVGDAQILSEKANLALEVAIQELPPVTSRQRSPDIHLSGAQNGRNFALELAALLELLNRGVQRNQIWNVGSRAIAAAKDLLEFSGLTHALDQKLVHR